MTNEKQKLGFLGAAERVLEDDGSSVFVPTDSGVFALRTWLADGTIDPDSEAGPRIFIAYYPIYEQTRAVLPVWDGELKLTF